MTFALRTPPRRRSPLALAGVAACLLVALPAVADAQWLGGIGTDALVLPRGRMRVAIEGRIEQFDQRYDDAGVAQPLATPLAGAELDATAVPALGGLVTSMPALTGSATSLSLGRLSLRADARRSEIPVHIDLGIGGRLQIGATIPYVQTRVAVAGALNPTATEGNLGLNPAASSTAAAAVNATTVAEFRAAAAALRAQLTDCASGGTGAACANAAAAQQLATQADAFATAVEIQYGGAGATGSAVVPVVASAAGRAVVDRTTSLRAAFGSFGVTDIAATSVPAGASAPLTLAQLQSALGAGGLVLGLAPLRSVSRFGVGDIEIGARFALHEGARMDPAAPRLPASWRASVGALVRLGTGEVDDPRNLFDLGVGDGQQDVELSGVVDIFRGRLATTIAGRYGVQLPDDRQLLASGDPAVLLPDAATLTDVRRDLGDYLELELTPRYAANDFLAIAAQYRYRGRAADAYETADGIALPTGTIAGSGESRTHMVGGGIVLSTLRAYAAGTMRVPLEIWFLHAQSVAGSGAPKAQREQIALRVHFDLFGGARR